jgi:hypothetical protein
MDTLTTPVLLRCMVTKSWKASVSIVAGSVKEGKTIHEVLVYIGRFSEFSSVSQCSAVPTANVRSYQCNSGLSNCNLCSYSRLSE